MPGVAFVTVTAAFSVKLTPESMAVIRAPFGMPVPLAPVMNMPTARPLVLAVNTTLGFVVLLVMQFEMVTAAPWIVLPTVSLLVSVQVMVVVPFSVQVALLLAKVSLSRVFQVVPPSGEICSVQPLPVLRSLFRA